MGDIADYYIGLALDAGRNPFGGRAYRQIKSVTCKHCGAENLKWRSVGERWVLVENERVHPGNYKPEHVCPPKPDNLEGFD